MNREQAIRRLEQAALDGHQQGQSWQAYFAAHAGAITATIRDDPGGWGALRDRLLSLLTSGTTDGLHAAGDTDVDLPAPVVPTVDDVTTRARLQPDIFPR